MRNDPTASKGLSRAALGLAAYGSFIFVFWYVSRLFYLLGASAYLAADSLSFNIYKVIYPGSPGPAH